MFNSYASNVKRRRKALLYILATGQVQVKITKDDCIDYGQGWYSEVFKTKTALL